MIQRVQSLWLLLASVAAFATLKLSFYSGNKLDANSAKVFSPLIATTSIILMVLTVIVAAISFVLIFLYKDRKRQLLITVAATVISLINIFLYFNETKKYAEGSLDLTSLISFVIPVFLIFAIRGIWKDEKLVKSVDRLR
jgi:hypothetical protein